jgi:hypothetical protein
MVRSEYFRELAGDAAYAFRMLGRTPGFTAVAVLTLGLGIGANSAIFSVVNGVLLESLPYRDAGRLHEVRTLYPDGTGYALSPPDFMSVREESRALDRVEAYTGGVLTLLGVGEAREVSGGMVSDGLFDLLGFDLAVGRGFAREEFEPGRGMVVVLDHGFGSGSSAVIGPFSGAACRSGATSTSSWACSRRTIGFRTAWTCTCPSSTARPSAPSRRRAGGGSTCECSAAPRRA